MVYIISIVFSILIAYFVPKEVIEKSKPEKLKIVISRKRARRDLLILLSVLPPLLVAALRYGIGTDYSYTYIPRFREIAAGDRGYYEFGFYYFNRIISFFTKDGHWLIVSCAIIIMLLVYRAAFLISKASEFSLLIFYLSYSYFVSFNNVRQSLASAILLLAFECLINKNRIGFIVLVILASSMHQVSFAFIVFIFIEKIHLSSIIYAIISFASYGFGKMIAPKIFSIVLSYSLRFSLYFSSESLEVYRGKTIGTTYALVNMIFMIMLIYLEYRRDSLQITNSMKDEMEWNIIKLCQCLIICICSLDGIVPAAYRIVRIFSFMQFIFIPNAIYKYEPKKYRKYTLTFLTIVLFGILFVKNVQFGAEGVFPYQSVFSK